MEAALNQTTFLTQAQALFGQMISKHTKQQNAEVKNIIKKTVKWRLNGCHLVRA